jgi:hypothetical protein
MNQKTLTDKLRKGQTIYLLDDFEEAVVRLKFGGNATTAFIKHKGSCECEVPQSNETVCEIILGGREITKAEYDAYR